VSVGKCADAILNLLQDARFQETVESTATLRDHALAAHVRAALRNNARTAKLDITIAADSGRVTLSGILDSDIESKATAEIIAAVPGVSGVTNELKTTTRAHRRFES